MSRVIRFDLGLDQPDRAIKFYSGVFGWEIEKLEGVADYWFISTGKDGQPGIDGGLVRRRFPTEMVTCWIDVPSVDDCLTKITEYGGKALSGKVAISGVGYYAYFLDTENNVFGLIQMDGQAK